MQQELQQLQQEHHTLQQANQQLKVDYRQLQQDYHDLQQEDQQLKQEYRRVQQYNKQLKDELQQVTQDNKSLQAAFKLSQTLMEDRVSLWFCNQFFLKCFAKIYCRSNA